jgi:RNA polymerase sigma factor (sigma-70 family)
VKHDCGSPSESGASFDATRWTVVMRAAQSQAEGAETALAELCQRYWYPLYVFARRRGFSPKDAEDLTQDFFLHLLADRALASVDPLKGKFRSFLLACFRNHISDAIDRTHRLKRGGGQEFVQMDAEDAEERYRREPVELLPMENIFDARWAMTVLGEAMRRLREEYVAAGKASTFEALEAFLDHNSLLCLPSYKEVGNRLGLSVAGVKTLVHRLRKRYRIFLRQEVGRTVSDPAEIDEEIHALCEALVASEGRLGP